MKKGLFAICMAAIVLTGCGNAATSGESTADTSSKAETASSLHEDEVIKYSEYGGIDMPYPDRMYPAFNNDSHFRETHEWNHSTQENVETVVFYDYNGYSGEYSSDDKTSREEQTFEDYVSFEFSSIENKFYDCYDSYQNDPDNFTIDSKEDIVLLGNNGTRGTGTYTLNNGRKLNFIYNTVFVGENGRVWWMVFTESNEQSELDEMQYLAGLPLNKAKLDE